jgi:hypothetical protein
MAALVGRSRRHSRPTTAPRQRAAQRPATIAGPQDVRPCLSRREIAQSEHYKSTSHERPANCSRGSASTLGRELINLHQQQSASVRFRAESGYPLPFAECRLSARSGSSAQADNLKIGHPPDRRWRRGYAPVNSSHLRDPCLRIRALCAACCNFLLPRSSATSSAVCQQAILAGNYDPPREFQKSMLVWVSKMS